VVGSLYVRVQSTDDETKRMTWSFRGRRPICIVTAFESVKRHRIWAQRACPIAAGRALVRIYATTLSRATVLEWHEV